MAVNDESERKIELAKEYFRRGDAGRSDVVELFTEDFQFYFPKFGIKRGKGALFDMVSGFTDVLASIKHDFTNYNFIPAGSLLAVEGTTEGTMTDGKAWSGGQTPGGRFCNVFEFRGDLICRIHVYLDPDYTGEDEARFRWGRDAREW